MADDEVETALRGAVEPGLAVLVGGEIEELAEGDLEETTVTCPCHGSQFDVVSGQVLRGPAAVPVGSFEVVKSHSG